MVKLGVSTALIAAVAWVALMSSLGQATVEIVDPSIVPRTGRVKSINDSIVFDLPLGKTVVFNQFDTLTLNLSALEEQISQLVSTVDEADDRVSAVASTAATGGDPIAARTLAEEVARLHSSIDDGNFIPGHIAEAAQLRVSQMVSQTGELSGVVSTINDKFPAMLSNLNAADGFVTDILAGRIKYNNFFDTHALYPSTFARIKDEVSEGVAAFTDAKASALSTVQSFEEKIRGIEELRMMHTDIPNVLASLSGSRFANPRIPIIRARQFSTYMQCCGWYYGNRAEFYGGVSPSTWSDGNAIASSMSSDPAVLRNFFNQRVTCGTNCAVFNEEWRSYSSTNGRHGAVLIRVRNTTPDTVTWPMTFFYSSYGNWAERASAAINGQTVFSTGETCSLCLRSLNLQIPPNRVSSIIFVVGGGGPSGDMRTTHLAFVEDSLAPPDGLEYVDDLDVATDPLN